MVCGIFKLLSFVVILSESFKRIKLYNIILAGLGINSVREGFLFKIYNSDWSSNRKAILLWKKITYRAPDRGIKMEKKIQL